MREVFNFSAGPSMLYEDVLLEAQRDMLSYNGTGMSVMEMSHRSKPYEQVNNEAEALLRELMNVPANYSILFVQGGASTQFEAVPLNLLGADGDGIADYIVTGSFSKKSFSESKKFAKDGNIKAAATSEDKNFSYIPRDYSVRENADYVHITTNNTIFGTHFTSATLPKLNGNTVLVADASSNILGEEIDVSKFGVIYAGAQKNIAPAGVTVVIVREDLLERSQRICPTMLKWKTQATEKSLYNTPPTFSIYMAMLTFRHVKSLGGVSAVQKINEKKAGLIYNLIDNGSGFYRSAVNKADRSIMNVPFTTPNAELDAKFVKEAAENGLLTLKGHRLVGGMRASIYNPMPLEGVQKLVDFMTAFEKANG